MLELAEEASEQVALYVKEGVEGGLLSPLRADFRHHRRDPAAEYCRGEGCPASRRHYDNILSISR